MTSIGAPNTIRSSAKQTGHGSGRITNEAHLPMSLNAHAIMQCIRPSTQQTAFTALSPGVLIGRRLMAIYEVSGFLQFVNIVEIHARLCGQRGRLLVDFLFDFR
jgi:hypothetical protein